MVIVESGIILIGGPFAGVFRALWLGPDESVSHNGTANDRVPDEPD